MRGIGFKYSRTAQPEKYESHTLEMEYALEEHDDEKAAVLTVMEQVNLLLGAPNPSPLAGTVKEVLQVKENLKELEKAKADVQLTEEVKSESKPKATKKTEPKTTKAKKSKATSKKSEVKVDSEVKEDGVDSQEDSPKKESKRLDFDVYDRSIAFHKKSVGALLTKHYPEWKSDLDCNKRAKEASVSLEGENMFIAGTKDVIPSFVEALKEVMDA